MALFQSFVHWWEWIIPFLLAAMCFIFSYWIIFRKLAPFISLLLRRRCRKYNKFRSSLKNYQFVINFFIVTGIVAISALIPAFLVKITTNLKPGFDGYTQIYRFGTPSMYITWERASDDYTPQDSLEYCVFCSGQDNIESVSDMQENGVALCDWTNNIDRFTIGNASGYYFNVMVRNQYGILAAYQTYKFGSMFSDLSDILAWIDVNIPDRSKLITIDPASENSTELGLIGMAMMQTNETYSAEIFHLLGAEYVMVNFGHLISGLCGNEQDGAALIEACNNHTAEYASIGFERENWYGEHDQVSTVFDETEYFNATYAPTPKWFDSLLVKLLFFDEPTSTDMATSQLEYWYAREINGDGITVQPRLDAEGNPWGYYVPPGGAYNLTCFDEAYFSTNSTFKIFKVV